MKQRIEQGLTALGLCPPEGAGERLAEYARLLLEQNQVMNLTAITQPDQVVDLHFLDSAALLSPALGAAAGVTIPEGHTWLAGKTLIDVGTGAGFPGLPLRLLEPDVKVTLLDSLGKRVHWLASLGAQLGVNDVRCLHARAEEQALEPGFQDAFDLATSRAVASLSLLCELCLPYVRVGGHLLAMKSVDCDEECSAALSAIELLGGQVLSPYDYTIPGTGVRHRVVLVEKISPTPKGYPRRWAKIQKAPL